MRSVYTFYYEKGDSLLVQNIINKTNNQIERLELFFKGKSKSGIYINLVKSEEDFHAFSSGGFPEWAQAVALVKTKTIIIMARNADERNRLPQVLLHELVHIYFGIIAPEKRIPTWLHEGVAQFLSFETLTMDEQVYIANALFNGQITPLMEFDSMFISDVNKAKMGYALARSAVDFFVQQYGTEVLYDIIVQLNNTKSLNAAFLNATGMDFIDFEVKWFNYVDKEYKWFILLNIENFIWTSLIILLVIAYLRMKFKNRGIISSWKEDLNTEKN